MMRSSPLSTGPSQKNFSNGMITGIVEKRIDSETYLIKTTNGFLSLKLNNDQLLPGDRISVVLQNSSINAKKNEFSHSTESIKSDKFTSESTANSSLISLLRNLNSSLQTGINDQIIQAADAVQRYLDKTVLDNVANHTQLKQILMETEEIIKQNEKILLSDVTARINTIANTIKSSLYPIQTKSDYTFVLPNGSAVKEGFFSVSSLQEAFQFLNISFDNNEIAEKLSEILAKNGRIIFRIQGDTSHYLFASIVSPQAALKELISFVNNLHSSLMLSLPLETIKSLFESKTFISLDLLKNIDELFKSSSVQFPNERAGSKNAGVLASFNWFSSIIDSPALLKDSTDLVPIASASKIVSDVKTINNLLNNTNHNSTPMELPGITDDILKNISKSKVISLVTEKLGFTLESRLLRKEYETSLQSSIKAELLKLSKLINEQSALNIAEHSDLINNSRNLPKDFAQIFSSGLHKLINDFKHIERAIDSQPAWNNKQTPIEEIKLKLSNILETYKVLENYQRSSITSPQISETIKNLQQQIVNLIPLLNSSDKKIEYLISELKNKLTGIFSTLEKLQADLDNLLKRNPNITRSVSSEQIPSSDQNLAMKNLLRQTIESTINRLESLQLLARQIPSSEGQQQMLALPIKIGDEWTEVNISFFKRHLSSGKKRKTQPSTFSVLLNVSPKKLGPITIKMDYEVKKMLKISMNFEFESAKNYFQKFEHELKSSLKDIGLPISSLEIRRKIPDSEQKSDIKLDTMIDMKV